MKLRTFVLVNKNEVVSPPLVTIREYSNWMEDNFDSSICQMELYLKTITANGSRVLERHPGTKIGNWFKRVSVTNPKLVSWIIPPKSEVVDRLVKQGMVERVDARLELRVYTLEQLEFYLRSNVDSSINMATESLMPIQIRVSDSELEEIQKPELKTRQKKLF